MTSKGVPTGLEDRVGLVTGGGGSIGAAVAARVAESGGRIAVVDIDLAAARAVAERLDGTGQRAIAIRADIAERDDVESMVRTVVTAFGPLDFAVNNAAVAGTTVPFGELTRELWDRTIAINLTGTFHCLQAELAAMSGRLGSSIVNVSSAAAFRPPSGGLAHYVASKMGLVGLTRSAAIEFVESGIRVNTVVPGSIDTPMLRETMSSSADAQQRIEQRWVTKRPGTPEEVASAITWLCSTQSSFVNGETLVVDGGMLNL